MAKPGTSKYVEARAQELEDLLGRKQWLDRIVAFALGLVGGYVLAGSRGRSTFFSRRHVPVDEWGAVRWGVFVILAVALVVASYRGIRAWRRRRFWIG